jgi:hypothetical protein
VGRNFEGYGEDPYLASRLVIGYIKGVQGEGVIASVSISPPTTRNGGGHGGPAIAEPGKRLLAQMNTEELR